MAEGTHLIPIFRELTLPVAAAFLDELAEAITERLSDGWSRAADREDSPVLGSHRFLIFERAESGDRPGLLLFISERIPDLWVSNIVPTNKSQLSIDEYNDALVEFADRFARPAAAQLSLEAEVGSDVLDLSEVLGDDGFTRLRAFSTAANRSTGSGHPLDRGRWFDFIWTYHNSRANVAPQHLARWLEADGWSEDMADELTREFEFAIDLLAHGNAIQGG